MTSQVTRLFSSERKLVVLSEQEKTVQLATAWALEDDIRDAAAEIADVSGRHFNVVRKRMFMGPNDVLYLLANPDFWRDLVPWAVTSLGTGALGQIGANILSRYYPDKASRRIEDIKKQTAETGAAIQKLMSLVESKKRYDAESGDVRFGIPTSKGGERQDVGFCLNSAAEAPLAVLAIAAVGEKIEEYVAANLTELAEGEPEENRGSIQGDITIDSAGVVQVKIWIASRTMEQKIFTPNIYSGENAGDTKDN